MNTLIDFLPEVFLLEILPDFLSLNNSIDVYSKEPNENQIKLKKKTDLKMHDNQKMKLQEQNIDSSL